MNSKPIITLFEENELNIAALYSLYAQKIPGKRAFWDRISNEEIGHAAHIGNEKFADDSIAENKFSRSVIRYVMDFVLDEMKKAQQNNVTHRDALQAALRIEHSILEKKCFDMFSLKNSKLKDTFCKLNKDTEKHVEMLLKEMRKNKFSFDDCEK